MKPAAICWHHVPNGAPEDSECVECLTEKDCELGFSCTDHKCVPRRPPAIACPGANYFGVGSNLEPTSDCQQFAAISPCSKDADCPTPQVCDIANTRCIDQLPECRFDDKCGKDCIDCKNAGGTGRARPHCLNGQVCVECRIDTDCALGSYCVSGDCVPCTDDRHCGQGCANCSLRVGADCTPTLTETPFCYSPNGQASGSVCVACMKDADCGAGNTCDTALHTCTYADPESLPACPPNLVRKGKDCVQCVSSSQCLCGSCDQGTNSCVEICNDNTDCQGNQCCTRGPDGIRKCLPGRCAGTAGGALCGCSVSALSHPVVDNNTIHPDGFDASRSRGALLGLLSMALFALVFRRRQLLWEARQGGPR